MIIQEGHAMTTLIKWLPESFYYQILCVLMWPHSLQAADDEEGNDRDSYLSLLLLK